MFRDLSGNKVSALKLWLLARVGIPLYRAVRASKNFDYNSRIDNVTDYIYSQNKEPASKMIYGHFKLSWNGCETIAIYNACKRLGKWKKLSEILLMMDALGAPLIGGYFGSNPNSLDKYYFSRVGIKCGYTKNKGTFTSKLKNSKNKTGIISFWNGWRFLSSLHTIMIYQNGNTIYAYNHTNSTKTSSHQNIDKVLNGKSFIGGYWFN